MIPILEAPVVDWYCPECGATDQTKVAGPHQRYHTCPKVRMMSIPMLQKGIAGKIEARDRDDYVKGELVQTDPFGRPIMSIVTTRDEGTDAMVFMPTVQAVAEPQ